MEKIRVGRDVTYESLAAEWRALSEQYLPLRTEASIWRFSRRTLPADPAQGWKLHISATVLNAARLLRTVGPFLQRSDILFKAPLSLDAMSALNAGVHYGYSQIGKCLTVYPRTPAEAKSLASRLHQLTREMSAPAVPFDYRYRPDSCVFYRYGAFKSLTIDGPEGQRRPAIRDPRGNMIPDNRESAICPPWMVNPFAVKQPLEREPEASLLKTRFKAFRALAQRGKGGVYQAIDLGAAPPRLCILKEGRRDGEVGWDGRDGAQRIQHEAIVLASLLRAGINVPRVYASFQAEKNHYLALELIEGENLEQWLTRKHRRLSISAATDWSVKIAELVSSIHRAGWVWRDCKPRNFVITKKGELCPIDFEGSCPIDRPDPLPWGTPTYAPPEIDAEFRGQSRLPEDLYALGVSIYILFAGCPPVAPVAQSLRECRRNLPDEPCRIVMELLDVDPQKRPAAESVRARLAGC